MAMLCHIATPTRDRFIGEIYYASVPGANGGFGVLPGHELFVGTNAKKGIATIWLDEAGNERKEFLVMDGVSQVYNNTVKILGRFCQAKEDLDAEEAKEKLEIQRARLEELKAKDDDMSQLAAEVTQERIEWYEYQLEVIGQA